jgi:hypothetical protein
MMSGFLNASSSLQSENSTPGSPTFHHVTLFLFALARLLCYRFSGVDVSGMQRCDHLQLAILTSNVVF